MPPTTTSDHHPERLTELVAIWYPEASELRQVLEVHLPDLAGHLPVAATSSARSYASALMRVLRAHRCVDENGHIARDLRDALLKYRPRRAGELANWPLLDENTVDGDVERTVVGRNYLHDEVPRSSHEPAAERTETLANAGVSEQPAMEWPMKGLALLIVTTTASLAMLTLVVPFAYLCVSLVHTPYEGAAGALFDCSVLGVVGTGIAAMLVFLGWVMSLNLEEGGQ